MARKTLKSGLRGRGRRGSLKEESVYGRGGRVWVNLRVQCFCRFALEVGQLSEPVQTDSGTHLIMRTA